MRISDWSSDVCSSDLSRSARPERDVLGDVTIIDRQELEQAGQDSLAEVLSQRHGIEFYSNRSEERRGGKECGSTCRSRWSPYHYRKNKHTTTNYHGVR